MTQKEINLSNYYFKKNHADKKGKDVIIDNSTGDVDFEDKNEHTHSNYVEKENGKGLFSGSYTDLTDKPSYSPTITSSTPNKYEIGKINLNGTNVSIYGKDTDTDTIYTAGTGLNLENNKFSVDTINATKIIDDNESFNVLNGTTNQSAINHSIDNSLSSINSALGNKQDAGTYATSVDNKNHGGSDLADIKSGNTVIGTIKHPKLLNNTQQINNRAEAQQLSFGETFTIGGVSINTDGHVTGLTNGYPLTLPSSVAVAGGANGLMSGTDKQKLDNTYRTFLECSSYNVDINDTNGITVTLTLKDYNNNVKSGTPVTLTCDKGYFTEANGLTENTYNNTTTKIATLSTNNQGKVVATWKPDDWGLTTFKANDASIQVNVNGWKHYEPDDIQSHFSSTEWTYIHFYKKENYVFLKVQGRSSANFDFTDQTDTNPNYETICTIPADCRPISSQYSPNFNYYAVINNTSVFAQGRLAIQVDDDNNKKKKLQLHVDNGATEKKPIFRVSFAYLTDK